MEREIKRVGKGEGEGEEREKERERREKGGRETIMEEGERKEEGRKGERNQFTNH